MGDQQRRSEIFYCLSILALGFLVYLPALQNGFAFDDLIHISSNPLVLNQASWQRIFSSAMYPGDLYRPLVMLTYVLTNKYFGLGAYNFHFDNNLLHAANAMLVFAVLRSLIGSQAALWAGTLFALNPILSEAVANVSGRAELLATFFVLASLFIVLLLSVPAWKPAHILLLPLLAVTTLAAFLSKESALMLIALAPLVVAWRSVDRLRTAGALSGLAVIALMAGAYLWLRSQIITTPSLLTASADVFLDNPLVDKSFIERLPFALSLLGAYARKVFAAAPLSADYSFAAIDPLNFWSSANVAHLLLCLTLIFALMRRSAPRELRCGVAWFLAAFAITSNVLFPIGSIFGERLVYLPSIGLLAGFAASCERLLSPGGLRIVGSLVAVLFAFQTAQHVQVWSSNENLFTYQSRVSPLSAKTAHNYGMVLRNSGNLDQAILEFRRAHEIYPNYADPAYGIASVFASKGFVPGAEHWVQKALSIDPQHSESLNLLGRMQLNRGESVEAAQNFEKALRKRPDFMEAELGLLAVAIQLKDTEHAKLLRDALSKRAQSNPEFVKLSLLVDKM
ncbi:MAG: hypothetical protein K1X79_00150 [Oligoflexia bacterium]|nr:hypothetical protein [Oligoflexia bacterium]